MKDHPAPPLRNNIRLLYIFGFDISLGKNGKKGIAHTKRKKNDPIIKINNSKIKLPVLLYAALCQ